MSQRIDTALVLKALAMALLHRLPPVHLLCHSDRGVQYASQDYRLALGKAGLLASMSRQGNCYDNARWKASGAPSNWNWFIAPNLKLTSKPAASYSITSNASITASVPIAL